MEEELGLADVPVVELLSGGGVDGVETGGARVDGTEEVRSESGG